MMQDIPPKKFADLLQDAGKRADKIPRAELSIMLRYAAIMVRNTPLVLLDDRTEDALQTVVAEMKIGREETIAFIVKEWLETNAYLPVHALEEDGDVEGNG